MLTICFEAATFAELLYILNACNGLNGLKFLLPLLAPFHLSQCDKLRNLDYLLMNTSLKIVGI